MGARGVPIDAVQHAIHEGVRVGLDLVVSAVVGVLDAGAAPLALSHADYYSLVAGARMIVDMLDTITTTISKAYVRELRVVVSEHHTVVHTLTAALLGGQPASIMARGCGIEIADRYSVLALVIPPHPDEHNPELDSKAVARRKLHRLQTELADLSGDRAVAAVGQRRHAAHPGSRLRPDELDQLIVQLSRAAAVPITKPPSARPPLRCPRPPKRRTSCSTSRSGCA